MVLNSKHTAFVLLLGALAGAWGLWVNRDDVRALFYRLTGRGPNGQSDQPVPYGWFLTEQKPGYTAGHLLQIPDPDSTPESIYENAQTGAQTSLIDNARLFGTAG